jgi:hypothetical protein
MAARWGFNYNANVILSTVFKSKNYNRTEDLSLNVEKFILGSSNKLKPGTTQ